VGERGKIQDFPKDIPYSSDKCSHSDMVTKTGIKPLDGQNSGLFRV